VVDYLIRRLLVMIPTLLAISFITFVIIQLPPGDYLTTYIEELRSQGEAVDQSRIDFLRQQFGLDLPFHEKYLTCGGCCTATSATRSSTICRSARWSATA